MGSDRWETLTLDEVAHYQNGRATQPAEARDDGMLVVKIRELNSGVSEKSVRVDPDVVQTKHKIRDGDLLFAWSASVGISVWRGEEAALNQHIFKVQAKPGTDQLFLRYLLEYELRALLAAAAERQTTMGHVRKADLARLTCRRPAIEEQRAIAEVLGALDDRIEWCGRLRASCVELLTTAFSQAALQRVAVGDLADVLAGQSPPGSTYNTEGEGLPFFQGSAQFGALVPTTEKWCTAPQRVAEPGDLLFSVRAPVGDLNVATEEVCIGRGLAAIRSPFRAATYAALTLAASAWSVHDGSGTVFGSINGRDLRATQVPWPDDVEALAPMLEALMDRALAADAESRSLATTRDALLPRLLSGEVRIEDPARLLGAVA